MMLRLRLTTASLALRRTLAVIYALAAPTALAQSYFDRYQLTPASPALEVGAQPLGVPAGPLGSAMARDRVLQRALQQAGHPLRVLPFQRGADMVSLLASERLEAGLLGDMPTLIGAAVGDTLVVGLVKQAPTALVASGDWQVQALAGKRIGYVPVSSAHHTLLQGLATAGLTESDVHLIEMRVNEMPDALARGEIDAFAAWEPATSLALAAGTRNRVVFRGQSSDYFVLNRAFAERNPEAARLLVAGYLRAINWMRRSQANVEQAVRWAVTDSEAFGSGNSAVSVAQMANIARRDLLDVPGAPTIIRRPGHRPLEAEFAFLAGQKKLPASAKRELLVAAFENDLLTSVQREQRRYAVEQFDYGNADDGQRASSSR
jgi:ABC-type nitrate/sulfonate/bicarbonate transport system substrate-binding protein